MSEVSHLWRYVQAWLDELTFPPTQSKLGERIGVSRAAVSDWKSGKTRPTPDHLRKLAELMEPQRGPGVYGALLAALTEDMGYGRPDFFFPNGPTVDTSALLERTGEATTPLSDSRKASPVIHAAGSGKTHSMLRLAQIVEAHVAEHPEARLKVNLDSGAVLLVDERDLNVVATIVQGQPGSSAGYIQSTGRRSVAKLLVPSADDPAGVVEQIERFLVHRGAERLEGELPAELAARKGIRSRATTDRPQNLAGEENQDAGEVEPL